MMNNWLKKNNNPVSILKGINATPEPFIDIM